MQFRINRPIFIREGKLKVGDIITANRFTKSQIDTWYKLGRISRIEYTLEPRTVRPVIVTGIWKRPDVWKLFYKHYKTIGIDVIVAGSEGETSRKLAKDFIYIEVPNQPLATKMNATTIKAIELGYTHVICVGSDDLLSRELIDRLIELAEQGYDFIGVIDFYFYDTTTKKAAYWGGYRERYRQGHTCGAARVISDRMLLEWDCCPWTDDLSNYLDTAMQNKIDRSILPKFTFSIKEEGLYAVDIKSSENMTPFKLWDNTEYIDPKEIEEMFKI